MKALMDRLKTMPTRRETVLFLIILAAVGFVLASSIRSSELKKVQLRSQITALRAQKEKQGVLLREYRGKRADTAVSGPRIATMTDITAYLKKTPVAVQGSSRAQALDFLTTPAALFGSKLLSVDRGAEMAGALYVSLPVTLKMSGSPRQLALYLEGVEAASALLSIEELTVVPASAIKSGALEWTLKLLLYFGKLGAISPSPS